MSEITTIKEEQDKQVQGHINDMVAKALQDPKTVENLRKHLGHDPADPREKANFKRWQDGRTAQPLTIKPISGGGDSHCVSRAKAIAKAICGGAKDISECHSDFREFMETSMANSKEINVDELISKAADVTVAADLRTVLGTEYDPHIYDFATRKVHVEDIIPSSPCSSGDVKYLRRLGYSGSTTYGTIDGNNAAFVAEVTDPVSPLTLTDCTVRIDAIDCPIRLVRAKITIEDEMLQDIPGLEQYLSNALEVDGQYVFDSEVIVGSVSSPHIKGVMSETLCQSYDWSTGTSGDNMADAVLGGIILAWLAENEPDSIPMSPLDYGAIAKMKDDIQNYLIPSAHVKNTTKQLWGLDLVITTAMPEGYAIPGSWKTSLKIRNRKGTTIQWTRDYGNDRDSNLVRAFLNRRAGLQIMRPEGLCVVHFDNAPA